MLPPCSIHGMRGGRKTSCYGLANKKVCGIVRLLDVTTDQEVVSLNPRAVFKKNKLDQK